MRAVRAETESPEVTGRCGQSEQRQSPEVTGWCGQRQSRVRFTGHRVMRAVRFTGHWVIRAESEQSHWVMEGAVTGTIKEPSHTYLMD